MNRNRLLWNACFYLHYCFDQFFVSYLNMVHANLLILVETVSEHIALCVSFLDEIDKLSVVIVE